MSGKAIKVFAPATVANVAVGFDHVGFAIDGVGDEIIIREGNRPGLQITKITGCKGKLPLDIERNTAGVAAQRFLESIGRSDEAIEMEIHKKMPFGSGLGSSAASAAAGVYGVERFLRLGIDKQDLLRFAVEGEQVADGSWHADNVAPSLLGGMIWIHDNVTLDVRKLYVPKGLLAVVIYPRIEILTKDSRSVLKHEVPFKDAVQQVSNAAAFVYAMMNSDFDLLEKCLRDLLVEPQRAHLIPYFYELKEIAIHAGALGFSISGAGPSMFALCNSSMVAEAISQQCGNVLTKHKLDHKIYISSINQQGAVVC